jgi:hypothetical protein
MGKRKVYIQNESKGYAIALMTVFILVLVIVAILSLLPGRSPKIGDVDKNGVARSFLFPFVFIDEHKTLFILNDDLDVTEIDDNAHSAVHDVKKNKVYYIRENTLYEYNIKKNLRVALAQDIDSYSILADRSGINSNPYGNVSFLRRLYNLFNPVSIPNIARVDSYLVYSIFNTLQSKPVVKMYVADQRNINLFLYLFYSNCGFQIGNCDPYNVAARFLKHPYLFYGALYVPGIGISH